MITQIKISGQKFLLENFAEVKMLELYQLLERCKVFAMHKAWRQFPNLPLELQDLEGIAWKAYTEVITKYCHYHGPKSFEAFFIDNVFWKCCDYCERFINNHHKILNYASGDIYPNDQENIGPSIHEDWNLQITLKQMKDHLPPSDMKLVFSLLLDQYTPVQIHQLFNLSRSKVYRLIRLLAKEIKTIV